MNCGVRAYPFYMPGQQSCNRYPQRANQAQFLHRPKPSFYAPYTKFCLIIFQPFIKPHAPTFRWVVIALDVLLANGRDLLKIGLLQFAAQGVKIVLDSIRMRAFWDDTSPSVYAPSKHDLRGRTTPDKGDIGHHSIFEQ